MKELAMNRTHLNKKLQLRLNNNKMRIGINVVVFIPCGRINGKKCGSTSFLICHKQDENRYHLRVINQKLRIPMTESYGKLLEELKTDHETSKLPQNEMHKYPQKDGKQNKVLHSENVILVKVPIFKRNSRN